jgi:phage/plasmid-associated DNA primase
VIPFHRKFPVNLNFLATLTTPDELSGFLNLALAAYTRAKLQGSLTTGDSIEAGAEVLKRSINPVVAFVAECTVIGVDCRALKSDVYQAYRQWAEVNGLARPLSAQRFNQQIQHRWPDLVIRQVRGRETWCGIGLLGDK